MKIAWSILLLLFCAAVVKCSNGPFPNMCARGGKGGDSTLPQTVRIPADYKVSAVFTDWNANSTKSIEEIRLGADYVINTTTRDDTRRWSTLNSMILLIDKNGCSVVNDTLLFSLPADISGTVPLNTSSLPAIVNSIVDKNITGFKGDVRVVSGVEGIVWIGCVNVVNSSSVVAVEFVYAGEDSLKPPSPRFNNPLVLSIVLTHFVNASDVNSLMTARVSLDFAPFEAVSDMDSELQIPHGTTCTGLVQVKPSVFFPDNFVALYTMKDHSGSVAGKMSYDTQRSITGETIINGKARLFNQSFTNDNFLVAHDALHGTEFVFSNTPSCSVHALPTATDDVVSDHLTSAQDLFIPGFDSFNFSLYSNVSILGKHVLEYRAPLGNKVIEVVVEDSTLTSIVTYSSEGVLESSFGVSFFEEEALSLIPVLNGCYKHSSNELTSFVLSGVPMDKIYKWREEVVTNRIAITLTSSIPNATISPHRLSFFFSADEKNLENTRVVLKVADGWEGSSEMTTTDFLVSLNATISKGITFTLSDKEEWKTTETPLQPYPPPPAVSPPSFSGYTGGSMFVLGIFTLIFGAAAGAGGVFIALKRQGISNLAYQVFE